MKNFVLGIFADLLLVLRPLDREIRISRFFEHCLVFGIFKPTSTVKLLAFCLRFQSEECVLRVNKSEITGENAFNGDLLQIKDNHESIKEEKSWF